jgi:hypothetical protein
MKTVHLNVSGTNSRKHFYWNWPIFPATALHVLMYSGPKIQNLTI